MRFLALLPFVCLASATPLSGLFDNGEQSVLSWYKEKYPGYNVDLGAQRLVQMDGMEPVLMTEMEKVLASKILFETVNTHCPLQIIAKAHGIAFMDMYVLLPFPPNQLCIDSLLFLVLRRLSLRVSFV
jgi:hypothetical protein